MFLSVQWSFKGILKHFKLSFGPVDLSFEMYQNLKRMRVLMFLMKFLSEILCIEYNDIVVVDFIVWYSFQTLVTNGYGVCLGLRLRASWGGQRQGFEHGKTVSTDLTYSMEWKYFYKNVQYAYGMLSCMCYVLRCYVLKFIWWVCGMWCLCAQTIKWYRNIVFLYKHV